MAEDENAQVVRVPAGTAQVQVVATGAGTVTVVVNGMDVSRQVGGVTIVTRPMQIPRILLDVMGDASFDGEGIVEYGIPAPVDEAAAKDRVLRWLDGLDWALLQASAAEGAMASPIGDAFHAALLDELDRTWW